MSVTIASVNVNGIRAATKVRHEGNPGMLAWLKDTPADIVLMQEVRATVEQTEAALAPALEAGWHLAVAPAEAEGAKGRAGVGILSRRPMTDIEIGFGSFRDAGRLILATVGEVRVGSLYLPSGSANTAKQDEKYQFLDEFEPLLATLADDHPDTVIAGDWNICHREQDLKNFKTNQKKSGVLPSERAFMDAVFGAFPDAEPQPKPTAGDYFGAVQYRSERLREATTDPKWFDVARRLQPEDAPYTWWTYRGQAFNNNAGWRIDYQAATKSMLDRAEKTWVERAGSVEERWSDHAPLLVTYA